MATCKWCGRSGWLLRVSVNGMCDTCEVTEIPMIVRQVQIIQECQSAVESGKTFESRVEHCEEIIRIAEELIPYELKGITVSDPSAADLKAGYEAQREKIITEHVEAEVQRILARAKLMGSPQSMVTEATNALLKIAEARNEHGVDDPVLDESEHLVRSFIHETRLNGYLQEAEKEEFKGNRGKALDQYQEALFFLTTERVDSGLLREHTGRIESKIRELRGES